MEKIAILIDAENIGHSNAKKILSMMEERGNVLIKMIIGNLISTNLQQWSAEAKDNAMTGIQQYNLRKGKNSSDMALAIQAMKILYEKPFITTFCIVSNDSDFTRLAQELKENDKIVIGMGTKNARKEFINAFSEYVYLDEEEKEDKEDKTPSKPVEVDNVPAEKDSRETEKKKKTRAKKSSRPTREACPIEEEKLSALKSIISELISTSDSGYAYYSAIADNMKKKYADFIPQNYNSKNVSQLMEKLLKFLPEYQKGVIQMPNNPNGSILYLHPSKVGKDK